MGCGSEGLIGRLVFDCWMWGVGMIGKENWVRVGLLRE